MTSQVARGTIVLPIAMAAALWLATGQGSAGPPPERAGSLPPATAPSTGTPPPPVTALITATPSVVHNVSIQDAAISPGETFTVALEAVGDPPGFYGFNIFLWYPGGLLHRTSCSTLEGFDCVLDYEPNVTRFFGRGAAAMTGALTLGTLTLRAASYNCEAPLRLNGPEGLVMVLDDRGDDIPRTVNDGLVTIEGGPAVASGDVNCDGVNSIDAALVLQVDAGLFDELPFPQHSDVSRDGRMDSVDAALILQFVAGLLDTFSP